MDVLELPRPVINFLRTMAKEGCRYVLSWDIFGGNDAITLTLTWKSNENDDNNNDQSQLMKTPSEQVHDDLHIARNNSNSSSRRSRRDETAAIFRSSRGKSLENSHPISPKPMISHPSFISSLERSSIITRDKNESDPIYANLTHIKPSNNSQRTSETSILRKNPPTSSASIVNETYSKLKRINIITRKEHADADDDDDDDDDETSDPWIKRLDPSVDKNTHATSGKSDDEIDKSINPSCKVKFKRKPDYF